ncbi:MAG: ATP-binding protein [Chitinophagaceae bacterium]
MHSLLQELDKSVFRYLFTLNNKEQQEYFSRMQSALATTDSFAKLTIQHSSQQKLSVLFKADLLLYQDHSKRAMEAANPTNPDSINLVLYSSTLGPLEDALRLADLMSQQETQRIEERTELRDNYRDITGEMMKILGLIFGLFTAILFFFMIREFRRRYRAQHELRQTVAELAHSKRELEQIAYVTSHDLQEPLRKIRVLIDRWRILQKGKVSPETADTILRINRASARMHDLVAGLMVLTTLSEDEQKESCSLSEIVKEVLLDFKDKIEEKKGEISLGSLPEIWGVPEQLALLFRNLIENSIKFSNPSRPLRIIISTLDERVQNSSGLFPQDAPYHVIAITDNGLGFDNKFTEKLFEIFRKFHHPDDSSRGIGLAIAKRIMVNHRGLITAHAFPNEGATFKLYFPT